MQAFLLNETLGGGPNTSGTDRTTLVEINLRAADNRVKRSGKNRSKSHRKSSANFTNNNARGNNVAKVKQVNADLKGFLGIGGSQQSSVEDSIRN